MDGDAGLSVRAPGSAAGADGTGAGSDLTGTAGDAVACTLTGCVSTRCTIRLPGSCTATGLIQRDTAGKKTASIATRATAAVGTSTLGITYGGSLSSAWRLSTLTD